MFIGEVAFGSQAVNATTDPSCAAHNKTQIKILTYVFSTRRSERFRYGSVGGCGGLSHSDVTHRTLKGLGRLGIIILFFERAVPKATLSTITLQFATAY